MAELADRGAGAAKIQGSAGRAGLDGGDPAQQAAEQIRAGDDPRKTYPGVEVRTARSRLIDENRIAAGDVALTRAARDAIAAARMVEDHPELANDPVLIDRALKLQAFFSQPFNVAEPFTKRPGCYVSRADALRGCREIPDGRHDDLPVEAFYFTGSIEQVRRALGAA